MPAAFALLLLVLSSRIIGNAGYVKPCKYWCKTEDDRYYCCPSGKAETWKSGPKSFWPFLALPWFLPVAFPEQVSFEPSSWWPSKTKEKKCPAVRPSCHRSTDWYQSPSYCHCDDECRRAVEKCCYDVCLDHKTCKVAE